MRKPEYRTCLMLLLTSLFLAAGCNSQSTVDPADEVAAGPYKVLSQRADRVIVQLDNGLIVAVQEVRSAPVVSVQCLIKTGSVYEQEHVGAGLSHFLEHLLSGGTTKTRKEEEVTEILGRIGARTNASTGLDMVTYYVDTTADHAPVAIDLVSDWMQNSQITEAEYQRERSVIQREFEMGFGSPGRALWKLTQLARYQVHPARHPTIGYLDEFLAITRDGIYDFYKRMYVPNNMLFVVAGDINKHETLAQIVKLWSAAKPGPLPKLQFPIEEAVTSPRNLSEPASINQPMLRMAWPGTRVGGKHDYALDLLAMVIGDGESSRLVRTIRDEQERVTSIDAYNSSFAWAEGFFGVDCNVAMPRNAAEGLTPEQIMQAATQSTREAILAQIKLVVEQGVDATELARAKRKVLARTLAANQSAHDVAGHMAGDMFQMGDPDYLVHYAQAIEAITAAELQAAAKAILIPDHLITILLEPAPRQEKMDAPKRPADPVLAHEIKYEPVNLDNSVLVARMNKLAKDASQSVPPVVIEPITLFKLSNGLRLLVQRNTQVPALSIEMYTLGGLLADAPGHEGVANAAAEMLLKGTQSRSAQQIAQQIEDLGASLDTGGGSNTTFVRSQCLKQDWQVVMDLIADISLKPAFPEDEWDRMRPRLVASLNRQLDNWNSHLGKAFREAYFKDHPWSCSSAGRTETITDLTAAQLRAFYQQHLGADNSVLVVVGDVDPQEIRTKAEQLFKTMPAKAAVPFNPQTTNAPVSGIYQNLRRQNVAAFQIGFGPGIARDNPDFAALTVLTRVLSSFPTGWLEAELRGSRGDGLAYAVWCYQLTGVVPGFFGVGCNAGPQQLPEALHRSLDVVKRARNELIDQPTLDRAKAAVLVGEFLNKQSNSDRATDAALDLLYGLGLDDSQKFMQQVRDLTPQSLQAAALKYLNNPVVVIISPEPIPQDKLPSDIPTK